MAEGLSTSSSSNIVAEPVQRDEDTMEPPTKKKCKLQSEHIELEERLNGILCCTVCLDLPTVSMLQVISTAGVVALAGLFCPMWLPIC